MLIKCYLGLTIIMIIIPFTDNFLDGWSKNDDKKDGVQFYQVILWEFLKEFSDSILVI